MRNVCLRGLAPGGFASICAVLICLGAGTAVAVPPQILHTPGFGSPERVEPEAPLVLAGSGLDDTVTVVYQAVNEGAPEQPPPDRIPARSAERLGVAPVLQVGDPAYYLTTQLPKSIAANAVYRLWAVNRAHEWSSPLILNKPRPLWITPAFAYASTDIGGLGRRIRVVGRNLQPLPGQTVRLRLSGPASYVLGANVESQSDIVVRYVAEATLPKRLTPGSYQVSYSRDGLSWSHIPDQVLEIRPDPPHRSGLDLSSSDFGSCKPDDGAYDDECLRRAIAAASKSGGGIIAIPPGTWDLHGDTQFVLPTDVGLAGAGAGQSRLARHEAKAASAPAALLILSGNNSITGIGFSETDVYRSPLPGRAIVQLGSPAAGDHDEAHGTAISDIVISGNTFMPVGEAVVDSGRPVSRLLITHNLFGAYHVALEMPGNRFNVSVPYAIDDSVIRDNRFVPGSYLDITASQGTIASELGAGHHLDFSANIADGSSTEGLQSAQDPRGFRAAFFWNMNGSHDEVLVARNHISCSGDKVGDGEAISFDGNAGTFAFKDAPLVTSATASAVTVRGQLLEMQNGRLIDRKTFYNGHWIEVVTGTGIGQVRRIRASLEDPRHGTVEFQVEPAWDVLPRGARVIVGREYHEVYAIDNEVDQRRPLCTKMNLTRPSGGVIAMWGPSAASVIEGNRQFDTSGITFQQVYTVTAPSCPTCGSYSSTQMGLEIRNNLIDGEYDWSSDCSWSGIFGSFAASPTPESLPPVLGFGIAIVHNEIRHADGLGGGAIDFTPTWHRGPAPFTWPLVEGLVVSQNLITDVGGSAPRSVCGAGQRGRVAVRLAGTRNVRHAMLSGNRCTGESQVSVEDAGDSTLCVAGSGSECGARPDNRDGK